MTTIHIPAAVIRAYLIVMTTIGIVLLASTIALALLARPIAVAEPQGTIAVLAGSAAVGVGYQGLRRSEES